MINTFICKKTPLISAAILWLTAHQIDMSFYARLKAYNSQWLKKCFLLFPNVEEIHFCNTFSPKHCIHDLMVTKCKRKWLILLSVKRPLWFQQQSFDWQLIRLIWASMPALKPTTANDWSFRPVTHSVLFPLSWATYTAASGLLGHHIANDISNPVNL